LHAFNIGGYSRHQFSGRVAVEESQGLMEDFVENIVAEVANHGLSQECTGRHSSIFGKCFGDRGRDEQRQKSIRLESR
jgi:hypothetical protein